MNEAYQNGLKYKLYEVPVQAFLVPPADENFRLETRFFGGLSEMLMALDAGVIDGASRIMNVSPSPTITLSTRDMNNSVLSSFAFFGSCLSVSRKSSACLVRYKGERFVIELKIWRGAKYHAEGESQLAGYLKRMRLDKGYMLTYSFKKSKDIGVRIVEVDGKELVEAMV